MVKIMIEGRVVGDFATGERVAFVRKRETEQSVWSRVQWLLNHDWIDEAEILFDSYFSR